MSNNEKRGAANTPNTNFDDYLSAGRIIRHVRTIANRQGVNGDPLADTKLKYASEGDVHAIINILGKIPGHLKQRNKKAVFIAIRNIVLSSTEGACNG